MVFVKVLGNLFIHRFISLNSCNNSPGCFDESRFETHPKIEREYICSVGRGVLNNPKMVPCCKNAFCHHCIIQSRPYVHDGDDNHPQQQGPPAHYNTLKCPICREEFQVDKLTDICLPLNNLLDKLRIKCSFKDCEEVVTMDNIVLHEYHCKLNPEREVSCTYCDKKLPYSAQEEHYCKERVLRKFDDVEKKTEQIRKEADKQKKMLERLLE